MSARIESLGKVVDKCLCRLFLFWDRPPLPRGSIGADGIPTLVIPHVILMSQIFIHGRIYRFTVTAAFGMIFLLSGCSNRESWEEMQAGEDLQVAEQANEVESQFADSKEASKKASGEAWREASEDQRETRPVDPALSESRSVATFSSAIDSSTVPLALEGDVAKLLPDTQSATSGPTNSFPPKISSAPSMGEARQMLARDDRVSSNSFQMPSVATQEPKSASHATGAFSSGVTSVANAEPDPAELNAAQLDPARRLAADASIHKSLPQTSPADTTASSGRGSGEPHDDDFDKVRVFYATNRSQGHIPLSSYELSGRNHAFMGLSIVAITLITIGGFSSLRGRNRLGAATSVSGAASACLAASLIFNGHANIEKRGVTYSGERGELVRGVAEVTVPRSHKVGKVERPSLLRFEIQEDQSKHIVLTEVHQLMEDDFHQRLSTAVSSSVAGDLLVFIHGYRVDFESALIRTAQISVDLPFEGVPICFSWPSKGTLMGYIEDSNEAEYSAGELKRFLLELSEKSGSKSINVVAHSMGNVAMTRAMEQISSRLRDGEPAPFDRVVLAAPDIDADFFRRDFAPPLLRVAKQVTLYASSDDQALVASKKVNGRPRAGDSGEQIVIVPGIDTIDVSGIDLSILGHSYYGDNESMLRDLYDVVHARLPATQRPSLIQRSTGKLIYWQLAQRSMSLTR